MLIQKGPGRPIGLAAAQRPKASVQHAYTSTSELYKAGIPIIAGTDSACNGLGLPYGLSMHLELYTLVSDVGMSPLDALMSATSITADRFGFLDIGKLEKDEEVIWF